jgi:general stress protein YciG
MSRQEGGVKAAASNKERYDAEYANEGGFYGHIGRMGGSAPYTKPKGFAAHPDIAVDAGKKGGKATAASRQRAASINVVQ